MNKFWEWMNEKEYVSSCEGSWWYDTYVEDCIYVEDEYKLKELPKQMLIGYMIEYIRDHEYWNKSKEQPFPHGEMEFRMAVWGNDQYKCFKEIIDMIDG